jgi:NhaA family Na+:H+ antiporter
LIKHEKMLNRVKKIFELEAATGVLLVVATALALVLANSRFFEIYQNFLAFELRFDLWVLGQNFIQKFNLDQIFGQNFEIGKSFAQVFSVNKGLSIQHFVNDALMTLFFLLVALELKEEVLTGELSSKARAMLPAIAALGGVFVPMLIFYFCNFDQPQNWRGFAISTATDIAFAYGVICLFGKKISKSLKVFLISLAIFDDLIAIFLIAFFYSQNLDLPYLIWAFLAVIFLGFLNWRNVQKIWAYLVLGVVLWWLVLKSGIHPTIAGVALAMFIPNQNGFSHKIIKKIAPVVNFLILPIFAFANSGVVIKKFSSEIFLQPLVFGIILALFLGKQIGVMLFSFFAIKMGFCHLPRGSKGECSWLEFYGVAVLTGIGFTMSFFIGALAFAQNHALFDQVKIAVLSASFLAALFGSLIIYLSLAKK